MPPTHSAQGEPAPPVSPSEAGGASEPGGAPEPESASGGLLNRIGPAFLRDYRKLPPYTKYLLGFQAFNSLSFNLCLGAPMILTALYLGASEAWVGIFIALTPFLVTMQLFSTNLAERWGYRRLMLSGWTSRAFALLVIVPLPLLHDYAPDLVPGAVLVLVMFAAQFLFNFIRGFASGTWVPWLSQLIPEDKRGLYLGWDNRTVNVSALFILLAAGSLLHSSPAGWKYSLLYVVSFAMAMASVRFLRRAPHKMPAVSAGRSERSLNELMAAARHAWSYRGFRRITRYATLYNFAVGAVGGFLIVYLQEDLKFSEGTILYLQAASLLGQILTAMIWGRLSDRSGSRPLMRLASVGNLLILVAWTVSATGWLDPGVLVVGALYVLMGLCFAAHDISRLRLVLSNCPEEELTVATTVYQVITSVALGTSPVLWGFVLHALRGRPEFSMGLLRPFSLFFLFALVFVLLAQILLSRIPEPKALPAGGLFVQIFWRWPMQVLSSIVTNDRKGLE